MVRVADCRLHFVSLAPRPIRPAQRDAMPLAEVSNTVFGWTVAGTAILAFVLSAIVLKLLDRLRKLDAENQARQIIHKADQEAATRTKEAELSIKERDLA